MFGLPLPWVALGAVLTLISTYGVGHHYGWLERDQDMQIEIAKKNEEARTLEREMTSKLIDKETALRKAKDDIAQKQTAMRRLAASGELRLPSSCVQASSGSPAAAGNSNQDAAELERQTINALIDIVADGDKAIVQLNACIDSYNSVKDLINGKR